MLTISSSGGVHELSGTVDAPVRAVWDVLSDTARINQVIFDLPPVDVVGASPERLQAKITVAGLSLDFDELPWIWQAPNKYRSVRMFTSGPLERTESSCALVEDGPRTKVSYAVTLKTKSGPLGFAAEKLLTPRLTRGLADLKQKLEATGGPQAAVWTNPARADVLARAQPFATALLASAGADHALVKALIEHIADAPDDVVGRIRPYELAERWHRARPEVLSLCLAATSAGPAGIPRTPGLLTLRWDTLCTSCKSALHSAARLADLPSHVRCPVCDVEFDVARDSHVEAVFAPTPAVRSSTRAAYCLGSPLWTPHWLAQLVLEPGAVHPLSIVLGAGAYYVQSPGIAERTLLDVGETGDATVRITLEPPRAGRAAALPRATPTVRAGTVAIALKNDDARARRVQLVHESGADLAATAAHVVASPAWQAMSATAA